ncbi:MAG: hypothetical protein ACP5FZ_00240 [Fidelibacterota bacterium]
MMNPKFVKPVCKICIIGLLSGIWSGLPAQPFSEPAGILKMVRSGLESIENYSVTVTVSADIPNLRMPDKELRLFYTKPDKFHVETDGFAMLPRIGLAPSQIEELTEKSTIELESQPGQNEDGVYILRLQPLEKGSKMTTTLWINPQRWSLDKIVMRRPDIVETMITIQYRQYEKFWLPETTIVDLRMQKPIPEMQRPSIESPVGYFDGRTGGEPVTGRITIGFSEYRVNRDIDSK